MAKASCTSLLLQLCVFAAAHGQGDQEESHPIEKVIKLLEGLQETNVKEGQDEEYLYTKFAQWCKSSKETLDSTIKEETETIDQLSDSIASKKEEEKLLTKQIGQLEQVLEGLDLADGDADSLRGKENGVYVKAEAAVKDTVTAIEGAIKALQEAGSGDGRRAAALQLAQSRVRGMLVLAGLAASEDQASRLRAFAESPAASFLAKEEPEGEGKPDLLAKGDQAAAVNRYQSKTGSVIEMLKDLKAKFESDKDELRKAETNAVNAYELTKAARADERAAAKKANEAKSTELADTQGMLSSKQGELTGTQEDLQADSALLSETDKKCSVKDAQWAERQKARALELEAMKKAVEILAKSAGVRTEAPSNPVPPPSPLADAPALLQLRRGPAPARERAAQLLRTQALTLRSKALSRLAEAIASHTTGPFDDVNNMIEKMIFHLKDEQMDEDKHKAWCDLEVNKTDASIANKDEKLKALQLKIDKADSDIVELANEIKDHNEMVEKITEHMKESAEIREVGKKESAVAIKDAQHAQAAIADAIAVLEAYYKESGMIAKEPYELAQTGAEQPIELPAEPSTWDASYTGVTDPTKAGEGVIAVLKTVSADFSKMEADTRVQEETDQKFFEEEMKESDIEKARRIKDVEIKTLEKKRQTEKVTSLTETKTHVQSEKEATEQYEADLQKACVQGDSTYEQRKADRAKEIEALGEAKSILKDAFKKNAPAAEKFLEVRRHKFF